MLRVDGGERSGSVITRRPRAGAGGRFRQQRIVSTSHGGVFPANSAAADRCARVRIPAPDVARQTVHHRRRGVCRLFESGPSQPAPELRDHAAAGGAGSGSGGARLICRVPRPLHRGVAGAVEATAFTVDAPETAFCPLRHGAPRSLDRKNPAAVAPGLTAGGIPDLPKAGRFENIPADEAA